MTATVKSTTMDAAWARWQEKKAEMLQTSREREARLSAAIRQARLTSKMKAKVRRP
jgi:hypothetical protein